jgi:hypothetical protein
MIRQARGVGRMEPTDPDLVVSGPRQQRRCRRCGAYLSASNREAVCFPCQRTEFEALWLGGGSRRRGRAFADRRQATVGG